LTIEWLGPSPPAFSVTYPYLLQVDSLSFTPYKQYGNKPFMHRYYVKKDNSGNVTEEGVISLHIVWAGVLNVLYYDGYISENFRDTIPVVPRIYKTKFDKTRSYQNVAAWDDRQAVIASVQRGTDASAVLMRAQTHLDAYNDQIAEPIRGETYDMAAMTGPILGSTYQRCSDPLNDYMFDAYTISGREIDVNGFITNTGESTIFNDIKIHYALTENGAETYVRMQKDTEFTQHNCGLYVADQLIEESGFQAVTILYDQDPPGTPGRKIVEAYGPLLVRQQSYKILHAYHDATFDACVYEKVVLASTSSDLLPYLAYRQDPIFADCQIRRTLMLSTTTYHIVVNGVATDLPYVCSNREYRLTALSTPYAGPALPVVMAIHGEPWHDIGFDKDGNDLGESNINVTRIFTDASVSVLLISLDAFPVRYRHNLTYDANHLLIPVYDTTIAPDPPSSDGTYPSVADRKWMLFGKTGHLLKSIHTPQKKVGDTAQNIGRVNGLCILQR
jgi:hypothetical protein